ncbi:MAG: YkgJ family cysteine cluster protein [Myxococcus sp.]|nr:YkgJ family cysteine cluster protein [Myxococcus sp.]
MSARECTQCGACCVAPDIAALDKPLGLACPHLGPDARCLAYQSRPQVCRDYQADELCDRIAAPTLEARVAKYLAHFELQAEADAVARSGLTSRAAFFARKARLDTSR